MKEITIYLEDEPYRLAEIKAAEKGTSVSRMIKEYLYALAEVEPPSWGESFLELTAFIRANNPGFSASDNLPREELYDRKNFR